LRYGIISDIHSNLEALEAALDFLRDVDALICPGDIVGYGPNPNECCDIIRERGVITVLGNHDAAVIGQMALDWFNPLARAAIEWTADQVTAANRAFLESLPLVHRLEHFVLVHGSLSSPEQFDYITSPWETIPTFAEMPPHNLCFVGHTHIAEYYARPTGELQADQISMASGGTVALSAEFLYIINCGSVGQPRDYEPRAAVGIFDSDAGTVDIQRIEYPIAATQKKMRKAGLPKPLWTRLEFGA